MKRMLKIGLTMLLVLCCLGGCSRRGVYRKAEKAMEQQDFAAAAELYGSIPDYADSASRRQAALQQQGLQLMEEEAYDQAADVFAQLEEESGTALQQEAFYAQGELLFDQGLYREAVAAYEQAASYPGAALRMRQAAFRLLYDYILLNQDGDNQILHSTPDRQLCFTAATVEERPALVLTGESAGGTVTLTMWAEDLCAVTAADAAGTVLGEGELDPCTLTEDSLLPLGDGVSGAEKNSFARQLCAVLQTLEQELLTPAGDVQLCHLGFVLLSAK